MKIKGKYRGNTVEILRLRISNVWTNTGGNAGKIQGKHSGKQKKYRRNNND